ncbi:serine/threonine-protein kinase [Nocardia sp. NPDC056000]|uniref:serine/threonine-protein kinase n=1 Tax=Nocardia sp. NPDC056000 TaxID=3345674 RepID=UPI0035D92088
MRAGEVFAGFRIERKLGAGGMGSVYLARHPRLPRQIALKVLSDTSSSDDEFRARFLREAELAARLAHPNVVAILDRGVEDESLWIAMQFVEGADAADLLREFPAGLPPERAVHVVTEAASGLDAAHAAGLLHRDVKPANILVSPDPDGPDRVLVTDFGIARAIGESTELTAAGEVLATVAYAAPEQLRGETLDHRVDVYALGATLYQLLTGAKPFPHETAVAVMQAHLMEPPPRPSEVVPGLPKQFDRVIARAMAKEQDQRYRSCGALAEAAGAALRGEAVAPVPHPAGYRKRLLSGAVAAVALVLAIAATAFVLGTNHPEKSSPATISAAPITDDSGPWGVAGFAVAAFPKLLPRTPTTSGYGGLWCETKDEQGAAAALDVRRQQIWLVCSGDGDPVDMIWVHCLSSRLSMPDIGSPIAVAGSKLWTRDSGAGRIAWGDSNGGGVPQGNVRIAFDDPARNFCVIDLWSITVTGQTLLDTWWPDAPL